MWAREELKESMNEGPIELARRRRVAAAAAAMQPVVVPGLV